MQINLSWDSSVSSAPANFMSAIQTAANILDKAILDPLTVTIQVEWGESWRGTAGRVGGSGRFGEYCIRKLWSEQ